MASQATANSQWNSEQLKGQGEESHLVAAAKRVCRQMADTFQPSRAWTEPDWAQDRADNQKPFESEMSEINITRTVLSAQVIHNSQWASDAFAFAKCQCFKVPCSAVCCVQCTLCYMAGESEAHSIFVHSAFLYSFFGMQAKYVLLLNCCWATATVSRSPHGTRSPRRIIIFWLRASSG